jgi:WD40 repeat protein
MSSCPHLPCTLVVGHVLPYLDRLTWNNFVEADPEVWRDLQSYTRRSSSSGCSPKILPPWPRPARLPTNATVQKLQVSQEWIAAGCRNGYIWAWHVRHGRQPPLRGHADEILALEFSNEGMNTNSMISMSHDTICVWEVCSTPIPEIKPTPKHRIMDVSLHLCSLTLFQDYWVCGHAGTPLLSVWKENICLQEIPSHITTSVLCLVTNGTHVAAGCFDRSIRLFEWPNPEAAPTKTLGWMAHSNKVKTLAFSPCGCYLASGSLGLVHRQDEYTIRLWNLQGECLLRWSPTNALNLSIHSVHFVQSRTIATAGMKGHVQLWNLGRGKAEEVVVEPPFWNEFDSPIYSIATFGNLLVSGSRDETVRLWSLED